MRPKLSRSAFASLLAGGIALACTRRPALAIIPVFDAAAYANAINEIAKTTIITQQQVQEIQQLLSMYNEAVRNGRININTIWTYAQPELDRLFKLLANNDAIPQQALDILTQFRRAFPNFVPDLPYIDLYENYREAAKHEIEGALRVAQAQNDEFAQESVTLDTIVHSPVQGRQDSLQVANMIAQLQVQNTQKLRGLVAAQITSEANFYAAMLDTMHKQVTDPGENILRTVFGKVPKELGGG